MGGLFGQLDPTGVVTAYKNLAHVERDFRTIKAGDLDLRPIHHRLDERVRSHVLIRMLAAYLVWHLRTTWAPLTFTDQTPPERDNPVAPAAKASYQHDESGHPYRSFRGLLDHLATLTRNDVRVTGTDPTVPILAEPTADLCELTFDQSAKVTGVRQFRSRVGGTRKFL
jgi:hypothetical protein